MQREHRSRHPGVRADSRNNAAGHADARLPGSRGIACYCPIRQRRLICRRTRVAAVRVWRAGRSVRNGVGHRRRSPRFHQQRGGSRSTARLPSGRRASAALVIRVSGSSQWKAVAHSTESTASSGRGQSSKADGVQPGAAMAAMSALSSTATIEHPSRASATLACPVPQPISSTREQGVSGEGQ